MLAISHSSISNIWKRSVNSNNYFRRKKARSSMGRDSVARAVLTIASTVALKVREGHKGEETLTSGRVEGYWGTTMMRNRRRRRMLGCSTPWARQGSCLVYIKTYVSPFFPAIHSLTVAVPPPAASPIPPHHLRIPCSPHPWPSPISIPFPHRRPCPRPVRALQRLRKRRRDYCKSHLVASGPLRRRYFVLSSQQAQQ